MNVDTKRDKVTSIRNRAIRNLVRIHRDGFGDWDQELIRFGSELRSCGFHELKYCPIGSRRMFVKYHDGNSVIASGFAPISISALAIVKIENAV